MSSPARVPVQTQRKPLDRPRGTGTVLLVDDDPLVLRALAAAVEALGYTALEAADGPHAIEVLREHRAEISAVVLDMVMPAMSGRATYSAMRELDASIAVLAMSGHAMTDEIDAMLALGVRGFIPKPASIDTLARSLADAILAR
jgi:CheY-like chemotaxis protein